MHYAGLLGHTLREAHALGWNLGNHAEEAEQGGAKSHNWAAMVSNVGDYIKGLNFNYKVSDPAIATTTAPSRLRILSPGR